MEADMVNRIQPTEGTKIRYCDPGSLHFHGREAIIRYSYERGWVAEWIHKGGWCQLRVESGYLGPEWEIVK